MRSFPCRFCSETIHNDDNRNEVPCPGCGQVNDVQCAAASPALTLPEPDAPAATLSHHSTDTNSEPAERAARFIPAKIGRFLIRRLLGEGAFGRVYEAHDPQLDRPIALKVAKLGAGDADQRVKRFLREAKAAANLRHPHIVPVYEYGQDGDHFYIASAYIQGRTLKDAIAEKKAANQSPDLKWAARIIRQMAEALAYAHSQGIVHRDIKPANTMLDDKDEPLIMDFGLAARQEEAEQLTHAGQVLGTPMYMAPEQAKGKEGAAIPASDQYSLGVMLYELVTWETPFHDEPELVMFHHQHTEAGSPRKVNREVSYDLAMVVLKCLEKQPQQRYESCQAAADDLRRWLEGEPIRARRLSPFQRLARWAMTRSGSLTLLVLISLSLLPVWPFWLMRGALKSAIMHGRRNLLVGQSIEIADRLDAFLNEYRRALSFTVRDLKERSLLAGDAKAAALQSLQHEMRRDQNLLGFLLIDADGQSILTTNDSLVNHHRLGFPIRYIQTKDDVSISDLFYLRVGPANDPRSTYQAVISFSQEIPEDNEMHSLVLFVKGEAFWKTLYKPVSHYDFWGNLDRYVDDSDLVNQTHATVVDEHGIMIGYTVIHGAMHREDFRRVGRSGGFLPTGKIESKALERMLAENRFGDQTKDSLVAKEYHFAPEKNAIARAAKSERIDTATAGWLRDHSFIEGQTIGVFRRLNEAPWVVFVEANEARFNRISGSFVFPILAFVPVYLIVLFLSLVWIYKITADLTRLRR